MFFFRLILLGVFTLLTSPPFSQGAQTQYIFQKNILKRKLNKINYYILSGEFNKAKAILNARSSLFRKNNFFHYYQSIFSYLEGDYERTVFHTEQYQGNNSRREKHLCQINILSRFMTKKWKNLYPRWQSCAGNFKSKSPDGQFFLRSLLEVTTLDSNIFNHRFYRNLKNNPSLLKKWLKVASYTRNSPEVEEYLLNFPVEMYQDKEFKNIISQIYYDNKKIQLSYEMLSGEKSKVSSLVSANLFITQGEFQKAYKSLKEAYLESPLSKALLARLVLLSFTLEDFDNSLTYIQKYKKISQEVPISFYWKEALLYLLQNNTSKAKKSLNEYLTSLKSLGVGSLFSLRKFIALQTGNTLEALYYSERSCQKGDPTGCWLKIILKKNFNELQNLKKQEVSMEDFIGNIKAGWESPQKEHINFGKGVSQKEVHRKDQLERTKEIFFLN